MRMRSSMVTVAPMRPSSSTIVVTSFRCGTLRDHHRLVGEQRAGEDRQRGVLGAGDAHLALERHAALDLQLVHAHALPATLPASAPRSTARGSRVPCARRAPGRPAGGARGCACRRTRARRCAPRNGCCRRTRTRTSAPGRPARISCATSSGFMASDITWARIAHAPIMPRMESHPGRHGHARQPARRCLSCWPPRAARSASRRGPSRRSAAAARRRLCRAPAASASTARAAWWSPAWASPATSRARSPPRSPAPARRRSSCTRPRPATATSA